MGTSGGGAGGGSGGFGGGGGTITIASGGLKVVDPSEAQAKRAFENAFRRLSTDYQGFLAGDPGVVAAYEALHTLHVLLVHNKSWEGVEKQFGVTGGKGCLGALTEVLSREDGPTPVHPRVHALLQSALIDFFRRIVRGDPVVQQFGDAAKVLATLDPKPFQSTAELFLDAYLAAFLRLEGSLSKLARERLRRFSLRKAKQVVAAFEHSYTGKPWKDIKQVGFTHLFRVMQGEPGWLVKQLRKAL